MSTNAYFPARPGPTFALEQAALLIKHYADAGDFCRSGYWMGQYRREQESLVRSTGKHYEADATGSIPRQVVDAWEAAHAARSRAARAKAAKRGIEAAVALADVRKFDPLLGIPSEAEARRHAEQERRCATRAHRQANDLRAAALSQGVPKGQVRHRRAPGSSGSRRGVARTSALSGDSGDDGPGGGDDDPPGGAAPPAGGDAKAERRCRACGSPCKATERTCARCRQQRSRKRKRDKALAAEVKQPLAAVRRGRVDFAEEADPLDDYDRNLFPFAPPEVEMELDGDGHLPLSNSRGVLLCR
jgi:hypothetical protein